MNAPLDVDPLYDTQGAAAYLGGDKPLSERTLEKWRSEGCGPGYIVLGSKSVRYRRSALEAFLSAGERSSTSEVKPKIHSSAGATSVSRKTTEAAQWRTNQNTGRAST